MFSGSKCVANHREEQSAGQTKMLWITLALIAAACTSLTVIFAKIGIKYVNSDFATFYRTGIVVVFSLILCAISGTLNAASSLTAENFVFLGLSGIATGCSWLCYYKAIKLGDVNKVAPVDKSSFVLSSLLFLIFSSTNDEKRRSAHALRVVAFRCAYAFRYASDDRSAKRRA